MSKETLSEVFDIVGGLIAMSLVCATCYLMMFL